MSRRFPRDVERSRKCRWCGKETGSLSQTCRSPMCLLKTTREKAGMPPAVLTPEQEDLITRAMSVPCPTCDSAAGVPCSARAFVEKPGNQFHSGRLAAARALKKGWSRP